MTGRAYRGTVAFLAGTTAAAAMLAASPGVAHGSDSQLLLSSDGVTYAPSLAHPVFGPVTGMVPGSSASAEVWVRNDSPNDAFLSVATLGTGSASDLATHLGLALRSPVGSAAPVPLNAPGSCADLAVGWPLAAGESARLTFDLGFALAAPNETRRQSAAFDLRFLLEDQDGSTGRSACTDGGVTAAPGLAGDGPARPPAPVAPLAVTGAADPSRWFLTAVVLLAFGTGALAYLRRKKPAHGEG